MSNDTKEELSALMDGEASELELRRVLKQLPDDPESMASWQRYHVCRSVMKGELRGADTGFTSVDLTRRISAAIDKEPALEFDADDSVSNKPAEKGSWWQEAVVKPMASVAIAASVSAMVVFGWQSVQQPGASAHVVAAVPTFNGQSAPHVLVQQPHYGYSAGAMPVAQSAAPVSRPTISDETIIRMAQQEDRLTKYLISHSGNAAFSTANGAMSYARVVNLKPETGQK